MDASLRPVVEVFREELREQAPQAAADLILASRSSSPEERREALEAVYRYAHSMKGSAASLGIQDLEELGHAVETVLTPYRTGEHPVSSALARTVLALLDRAPARVEALLAGSEAPDPALRGAVEALLRTADSAATRDPAGGAQEEAPPAAPPGEAASPAAEGAAAEGRRGGAGETMRVAVQRLVALDRQLDALREVRAALEHRTVGAQRLLQELEAASEQAEGALPAEAVRRLRDTLLAHQRGLAQEVEELGAQLGAADEELRQVRVTPVELVLAPLPRAAWEHAERVGKRVRLEVRGAEVALDRRVLEALKDPLVHLVRNAVDHGLEAPEVRARAGKAPEGCIRVQVEQRGAHVVVEFSDDGRGVDLARVRARAVERGLVRADAAAGLPDEAVLELLFLPGFSTAESVSRTSGRGVGLDVVRENLHRVGGTVGVTSEWGRGTRFRMRLPLTLATAHALLVEAGGMQLALPLAAVESAHHVPLGGAAPPAELTLGERLLPLHSLGQLLGLPAPLRTHDGLAVVVVRAGELLLALAVDRLQGEHEVVVRPLPPELRALRQLEAGASVGDGRVLFVLSPRALTEAARSRPRTGPPEGPGRARRRVLVADDSITTRALHRQVLEAAGFEVETAGDGEEALRALLARGADLVVSDVRMPRLDGLALTRRVRQEPALRALPVVLVSSLDTRADEARAVEAGATAFLSKRDYQRGELLRLVRGLLP